MGWLDGYSAVVTGGAGGIGRAVSDRFVAEGAGVCVLDRDEAAVAALEASSAGHMRGVAGDVRDYASHAHAVEAATAAFGKLDVLVANAGVFDFNRPLAAYDPQTLTAALDELLAINLRGYLFAVMAAREALRSSGGSVILTVSIAGFHAGCGGIAYTAAKHAVVGVVRQLALELAPEIRVNGVGPGGTLTDLRGTEALGHAARTIRGIPAVAERIAASVPLQLAQRPEDHAGLYVLLASRENARAITGEVLMSDGGVGVRPV